MHIWDDIIPESDREIYEKAGYIYKRMDYGDNPALVIIDVNYNFVGDKPEPILKSIERFPQSCGENGWKSVYQIASLLPLVREKRIPVVYSTGDPNLPWTIRKGNSRIKEMIANKTGHDIVREIAPEPGDIVIHKVTPSVFLRTPLVNLLIPLKVDTLLFCGGVTSGCVRASVVDAASYGFKVGIIEECTFDRGEVSHKVNLFDMNAKYASVVSIAEVKEYLGNLQPRS
ncbi:isochorismatase family protein [Chloroflexota bacterium]